MDARRPPECIGSEGARVLAGTGAAPTISSGAQGQLLTIRSAANFLGVSVRQAYRWSAEGRLPGVLRIGRAVFVSRSVLEAWLRGSSHDGEPLGSCQEVRAETQSGRGL